MNGLVYGGGSTRGSFRRGGHRVGSVGDLLQQLKIFEGLNVRNADGSVVGQGDGGADGLSEKGLTDGGFVGDDAAFGGTVPGTEDAEGFGFSGVGFDEGDGGADRDDGGVGILEIGAAGIAEGAFQFGFAAGEDGLLFFGGFELEVFAKIAVGAGDLNIADVLRNLAVDEVVEFFFATFEAGPGDGEGFVAILRFAADHGSQLGAQFDEASEEGAFVEVVEDGGEEKAAHGVADDFEIGFCEEVGEEGTIVEDEVAEFHALLGFGELVELEGAEDCAKEGGVEEMGVGAAAFLAEPEEDFGGGGAFVDPAVEGFCEFARAVFALEEFLNVGGQARGAALHEVEGFRGPFGTEGFLEGGEGDALFGGGEGVEEFREIGGIAEEGGDGGGVGAGLERFVAGEDFIAG